MSRLHGRLLAALGSLPGLQAPLIAVLTFPAWRPLLAPGYPGGHDSLFHLFRLVELDLALRAGELYPRLAPNLALGYDYPVFNYYAPLSVYLAALLKLAGLGYVDAIKAVLVLSVVGSGWTMLLYARTVLPRWGAWTAALAYAYLPYLLVDVYVRGALAEAVALPILPLCLLAFRRLAERLTPGRVAAGGLTLALLLVAHNVTTLTFAPVLAAFWLLAASRAHAGPDGPPAAGDAGVPSRSPADGPPVVAAKGATPKQPRAARHRASLALGAAAAVGLALALAAFYWAPALLERDLVASGGLTRMFFDYHEHFQPLSRLVQTSFRYDYGYDFARGVLFRTGLAQVAVAILGVLASLPRAGTRRRDAAFWGAVLGAGILLQSSRTAPLWEAVPLAAYVQFPWRLLALVGLASSLLAGHLVAVIEELGGVGLAAFRQPDQEPGVGSGTRERRGRRKPPAPTLVEVDGRGQRTELGAVAAAIVTITLAASAVAGFNPGMTGPRESDVKPWLIQRRDLDRKHVAATVGEYLPITATTSPFDYWTLPPEAATAGDAALILRNAGPFHLELDAVASAPSRVVLDRFLFPGWRAEVDGREAALGPIGPLGLLSLDVPAGEHRLRVWLSDTPVRAAAWLASAAGALVLALLLVGAALAARRSGASGRRSTGPPRRFGVVASAIFVSLTLALSVGAAANATTAAGPVAVTEWAEVAADFGPTIRLAGAVVGGSDRGVLSATLYWHSRTRQTRDLLVALRLLDADGRVVGGRDKRPLFGLRPTTLWEAGQVTRDHQEIGLAPGTPAGEYELVAGLVDSRTGAFVRPTAGPAAEWRSDAGPEVGVRIGRVRMPGRPSVAAAPLARQSAATFGGAVALESYQISGLGPDGAEMMPPNASPYAAVVGQGERVRVRLRWRPLRDLDRDYAVFAHLLDSSQKLVAQDDEWPHRGYYPTSLWLPGEPVDDEYVVEVPKSVPPGHYDLSLGLYTRSDLRRLPLDGATPGADRLSLGSVKVTPRPPLDAGNLPAKRRLDARLGDVATLLGYDLRSESSEAASPPGEGRPESVVPKPGDRLALTLYWQASRRPSRDYTVFVHLYDAQGALKAQADGPPAAGSYPTTAWEPSEVVVDGRVLALDPGLPPGRYRLEVGMYLLETGVRLKLPSGEDRALLEEIVVTR